MVDLGTDVGKREGVGVGFNHVLQYPAALFARGEQHPPAPLFCILGHKSPVLKDLGEFQSMALRILCILDGGWLCYNERLYTQLIHRYKNSSYIICEKCSPNPPTNICEKN